MFIIEGNLRFLYFHACVWQSLKKRLLECFIHRQRRTLFVKKEQDICIHGHSPFTKSLLKVLAF